jgi:hypothetical protein
MIDLIRGEPLAWSLCGEQHRTPSNLLAQSCKCRRKVRRHCPLAIGSNAELARKEGRTKFGQHAGDLAARWSVARRHRATRKSSVGGGQRPTDFGRVSTHRAMPLASKSPS